MVFAIAEIAQTIPSPNLPPPGGVSGDFPSLIILLLMELLAWTWTQTGGICQCPSSQLATDCKGTDEGIGLTMESHLRGPTSPYTGCAMQYFPMHSARTVLGCFTNHIFQKSHPFGDRKTWTLTPSFVQVHALKCHFMAKTMNIYAPC
jgi:hypothetical protein